MGATDAAHGLWEEYWKKPPHVSRVSEKFPLLAVLDDGRTLLTKNSDLVRVIELQGRDYTGMAEGQADMLYGLRKQFFESAQQGILLAVHSLRHRVVRDVLEGDYGDPLLTGLLAKWGQQFRESFRTRHVLVVRTSAGSFFNQLLARALKRDTQQNAAEQLERLDMAVQKMLLKLEDYRPRVLEHDAQKSELLSFWAWLLNGRPVNFHTEYPIFDDLIAGTDLYWPQDKNHQIYRSGTTRYSAWLAIKAYPGKASGHLFDLLYRLPRDFSLHQSFQFREKNAAVKFVDDRMRHTFAFMKSGGIQKLELEEAMDRVEAEEVSLCEHAYALQVFGANEADLNHAVNEVRNALEARGIMVMRETANQEALFWSMFPGNEHMNIRVAPAITSENAANFVTFSAIGEGLDTCSFGPEPVTVFRTPTGSDFSFTFHATPEPLALGHTLAVGRTGCGKTTLISFLIANCAKYPNFRALLFDRLHGMEVMTRMLAGDYEDFSEDSLLNPLQLPDTKDNRAFLAHWFELLTGVTEDSARAEINLAIDQAYRLDRADRRLEEIADAFGLKHKGSVRAALDKWLPGGQFGHYFNGKRDALSFDKSLVAFDATTILDLPEVLGAATSYLFHRFTATVLADPGPYVVFFDEANKFIEAPAFGSRIRNLAQEIRKTNGVLVAAVQEPSSLLGNEHGKKLIENCATYLLYPNATAEKEHYIAGLGLNESEFAWIKAPSKRQVMVKRREGESTIINVDLSQLGNYLRVFDSAATSVVRLNKLRKRGEEWRHVYLTG